MACNEPLDLPEPDPEPSAQLDAERAAAEQAKRDAEKAAAQQAQRAAEKAAEGMGASGAAVDCSTKSGGAKCADYPGCRKMTDPEFDAYKKEQKANGASGKHIKPMGAPCVPDEGGSRLPSASTITAAPTIATAQGKSVQAPVNPDD